MSCPFCRKQFHIPANGVGGLQHHFFIQHLVDARTASSKPIDEVPCEVCFEMTENGEGTEKIPSATVYCVDCSQKLCERCSRPHRKWKGGAHRVQRLGVELEQEIIQMRQSFCDQHKEEVVKLYCHDCNENICLMCFAVKHTNHNSCEIPEVAGTFRSRIDADDMRIVSGITDIHQQSLRTTEQVTEFYSEVEKAEKMVVESGEAVKRIVDNQVSECLHQLQSLKSENAKQVETIQEQIQLSLVAMESCHAYARELLDKGRPSDVTRAASKLHERATELLNSDVASIQYVPPRITFSPAVSTHEQLIGKLVVTNGDALKGKAWEIAE